MNILKMSAWLFGGLAVALLALPTVALGSTTSDELIIRNAAGVIVLDDVVNEGSLEPTYISSYYGTDSLVPVVFLDPDGSISDVVGLIQVPGDGRYLAFQSDSGPGQPPDVTQFYNYANATVIPEPTGPYDVSIYLNPNLYPHYTATFQSDVETPPVPEPVTMFSAFMAISGLGMYIRRRMRVQAA